MHVKFSCAFMRRILRMHRQISRMHLRKITRYAREHKQVLHAGGTATL